jgi:hypothetical protein
MALLSTSESPVHLRGDSAMTVPQSRVHSFRLVTAAPLARLLVAKSSVAVSNPSLSLPPTPNFTGDGSCILYVNDDSKPICRRSKGPQCSAVWHTDGIVAR